MSQSRAWFRFSKKKNTFAPSLPSKKKKTGSGFFSLGNQSFTWVLLKRSALLKVITFFCVWNHLGSFLSITRNETMHMFFCSEEWTYLINKIETRNIDSLSRILLLFELRTNTVARQCRMNGSRFYLLQRTFIFYFFERVNVRIRWIIPIHKAIK